MKIDLTKIPRKTLGWVAIDWIEDYLCHGPGDILGTPFRDVPLTDEQCRFLLWAYWLHPDGRRWIRRAFLSRAKGWTKSELAGAVSMFEALGPSRFAGLDSKRRPVGRPVVSPEILCVATEEGQAGNTYDNIVVMGNHLLENHGDEFTGLDVGLTRTFLPGGGEITPISAKARSKDGGRSTFAVFDETHLYDIEELRRLHATIRRNLGKRAAAEPWSLETSTMYLPGADSVAEDTHSYAQAIEEGELSDSSLLFDHRQGPEDFDWENDQELRAALVEAYGDSASFQDFDRKIAEIRDPQADEADSRRFWLNQVVPQTEQAFDPEGWKDLADPKYVIRDGALVVLGFHGARFNDTAVLIGTEVKTGHQFVLGIWEPQQDGDDWEIDEEEVDQAVSAAFDRLDVWRLYGNPYRWESALDRWAGRWEKRVIRWWTNRNKPMAYALRSYLTAIKTGELTHDGDSVMASHLGRARKRIVPNLKDEEGGSLWVLTKGKTGEPINAAVAGCLSWEARGDAIAAGAKPRRSGRAVGVTPRYT